MVLNIGSVSAVKLVSEFKNNTEFKNSINRINLFHTIVFGSPNFDKPCQTKVWTPSCTGRNRFGVKTAEVLETLAVLSEMVYSLHLSDAQKYSLSDNPFRATDNQFLPTSKPPLEEPTVVKSHYIEVLAHQYFHHLITARWSTHQFLECPTHHCPD